MAFPTTGLIDDFNRSDVTPLGSPWFSPWWYTDSNHRITSNKLMEESISGWHASGYDVEYGPDCEVYLTVDTSMAGQVEMGLRGTKGIGVNDRDGYFVHLEIGTPGTSVIWKVQNGSQSQLSAGTTNFPTSMAFGSKIGFEAKGNVLTVYHRPPSTGVWEVVESVTDGNFTAPGYLFVVGNRVGTGRTLDDFSGGTIVVPGAIDFPTTSHFVIDNFDRTDDVINGDATSGGYTWSTTLIAGTGAPNMSIVGKTLQPTGLSGTGSGFIQESFGPDTEVYCTAKDLPADGDYIFLCARAKDVGALSSWDGYGFIVITNGGSSDIWQLRRYDDGSSTVLGSNYTGTELAIGDWLGFSVVGSLLTAYHKPVAGNWTELFNRTDSTYTAAGKVGIEFVGATVIDSFSGGTVVAAPAASDFQYHTVQNNLRWR